MRASSLLSFLVVVASFGTAHAGAKATPGLKIETRPSTRYTVIAPETAIGTTVERTNLRVGRRSRGQARPSQTLDRLNRGPAPKSVQASFELGGSGKSSFVRERFALGAGDATGAYRGVSGATLLVRPTFLAQVSPAGVPLDSISKVTYVYDEPIASGVWPRGGFGPGLSLYAPLGRPATASDFTLTLRNSQGPRPVSATVELKDGRQLHLDGVAAPR
jgi:hypothetical protein